MKYILLVCLAGDITDGLWSRNTGFEGLSFGCCACHEGHWTFMGKRGSINPSKRIYAFVSGSAGMYMKE